MRIEMRVDWRRISEVDTCCSFLLPLVDGYSSSIGSGILGTTLQLVMSLGMAFGTSLV